MEYLIFCLPCFLIGIVLYIIWPTWKLRHIPALPSVWGIGHLHLMEKHQGNTFLKLAQQLGPVYRFQMGRQPIVFVATAELCQELGIKKFKYTSNRSLPPYVRENHVMRKGLTFSRDSRWSSLRSLLQPIFHPDRLSNYAPLMQNTIRKLIEILEKKSEVNITKLLHQMNLTVIGETAFGNNFSALEDNEDSGLVDAISSSVRALRLYSPPLSTIFGIFFPILQHPVSEILRKIPGTGEWKTDASMKRILILAQELLNKRQKEIGLDLNTNRNDVISILLKAREKNKDVQQFITDEDIIALAYEFILAGTDTCANTTAMVLYHIAGHPHVEEKLLREIDSLAPIGCKLLSEDIDKFTYLDQVIKESMRVFMISPITAREASEDIQLGGYHLPKGTWVWMAYIGPSEDPVNFKQPQLFNPERFDIECEENKKRHPFASTPFGLGPRMCPGLRYAKLEIKLAIIHLYQHFTFEHSPLMEKPLAIKLGMTAAPKHGIKLRVHKRSRTQGVCACACVCVTCVYESFSDMEVGA